MIVPGTPRHKRAKHAGAESAWHLCTLSLILDKTGTRSANRFWYPFFEINPPSRIVYRVCISLQLPGRVRELSRSRQHAHHLRCGQQPSNIARLMKMPSNQMLRQQRPPQFRS